MDKEKIVPIIAVTLLAVFAKDQGADIFRSGNRHSIIGNDRPLLTLGTQSHELIAGRIELGANTRSGLIIHTNGELNLGDNRGVTTHNNRVGEIGIAFHNQNFASLGGTIGIDGEDGRINGALYIRLGGPSQP